MDVSVVGAKHVEVAGRARDLLARYPEVAGGPGTPENPGGTDKMTVGRARRLRRFLSQPMFVAEPWIRWKGQFISIADTLHGCELILDGAYDDVPEEVFYMAGTIEQVAERAKVL